MKISLKWLSEYVPITLPPKELAHKLTMSGTEVAGITTVGGSWDNIFIAEVLNIERHPNADRLVLATVELGGEQPTVVCGAPNLQVGQRVPFAKVGARLIDPRSGSLKTLETAKIRGVMSEGMICSEAELGISDEHEGIMVLSPDATLGTPLTQHLGDYILDLDITPNRPDCLSVLGVAWEVGAITQQYVSLPKVGYPELWEAIEKLTSVEIADPDLCSRYCASLVTDIKVGLSPQWMQDRLIAVGQRPINNIVDITNYVMLEYGQPLHAFDYEKLEDRKIIVRRAKSGEKLVTLDGVEHPLDNEMLVIADARRAVGLAGVMGGANTEVSESTITVLLESANFNFANIRRTAAKLRLRTEASLRFDKGLSPQLPIIALRRATQLFVELAGGKAAEGVIDAYPGAADQRPIKLTEQRVKKMLGMEVKRKDMGKVLTSLGFQCQEEGQRDLLVSFPFWRTDVSLEDDLVEEVVRIIGYDSVPTTMLSTPIPKHQPDPMRSLKDEVRELLVGCGMQEAITYTLTSKAILDRVSQSPDSPKPLRVSNPMSAEQECLRTTLRGGLLSALAANERYQEGDIRLFEVGKVYLPQGQELPLEREVLGGVISCGSVTLKDLFFQIKGVVELLFHRLGGDVTFEIGEDPLLHPGRSAVILVQGAHLGMVGEVHPRVLEAFDIGSPGVGLFELDLEGLLSHITLAKKYQPVSRYPSLMRDIALVLDEGVPAKEVQEIMKSLSLVKDVALFDVYTGEQIPSGKKSLAYRIEYHSPARTLTDEEVNKVQAKLVNRLCKELGATLRG